MKLRPFLLSTALSLLALCFPATLCAQFLGYTSPQTVSSTPLNAVSAPAAAFVPNLGQSIHSVVYKVTNPCVGAFGLDIRIEASNDGVSFFSISEDAVDQPNTSLQGSQLTGGITAQGYYPVVRVNLVKFSCGSGTPTLTAVYSGTSTSNPTSEGVFGEALPYRKALVVNADTTLAPPSVTVTVPTGNSAGTVYIQCSTATTGAPVACPTTPGGTINAVASIADSGGVSSATLISQTIQATSSLQTIRIPAFLTNRVSFGFSATGGGGGVNWSIYYQIDPNPGSTGTGVNAPQVQTNGADPCQSSAVFKLSAVVTAPATSTTQIVPLSGLKAIYVCGYQLTQTTAVGTLQWEYGTGASCGTGTATLTGAMPTAAGIPLTYGGASETVITAPGGNALCLVTAGAAANAAGVVTYVQQ